MRVRLPLALALLSGAAAFSAACSAPAEQPRLVLLYVPCTVSKAYVSPYNPEVTYTPHLERFSRNASVFTRHQTESGQSGIAYASIFAGAQATKHGVYSHPKRLDDSLYLISEAFRDNGYETFFWGAHPMASATLNYGQGVSPRRAFEKMLTADDEVFAEIIKRIRANPGYRAFMITTFTVSHAPYSSAGLVRFCASHPKECERGDEETEDRFRADLDLYRRNHLRLSYDFPGTVERLNLSRADVASLASILERLYASQISTLDLLFGRIIDRLRENGLLDSSLIAFTADHGEVLYRDNAIFKWTHGHALAPEVLSVPLIIHAPGSGLKGGRYEGVTRSIDVYPTVASLAGITLPGGEGPMGLDLSPAMRGTQRTVTPAYSHTSLIPAPVLQQSASWNVFRDLYPRSDPNLIWVSARSHDTVFKLRNLGEEMFGFEVYDLSVDPGETKNLYDTEDAFHREMTWKLTDYKAALVEAFHAPPNGAAELEMYEQRELLRSLGYIR